MSNAAKESSSANDLLKNSSLYREFQAEREEILRHKWIESEKAGRDIGFELAQKPPGRRHELNWNFVPLTPPCEVVKENMNAKRITRIGSAHRRSRFAI